MSEQTHPSRGHRRNHASRAGEWPVQRVFMLLSGVALLVLSSPPFFNFPVFSFWLLPLGIIYLLLLLVFPRMWLLALPVLTVVMDFAPWTGRFVYNEYDWIFLLTLASGLLYNRYRFKVFAPSPAMAVLLCYLLVAALGYSGWIYFLSPPQSAWQNPYYTDQYAYKAARGMIWGIALVPMWGYLLAVNKLRAVNALVTGICAAALCLGLLVLWERGTLGVLLSWSAWYHVVSSLLDLSSSYRVTAWFSDMHTGGEAYDGVLLLLLPATMYGTVYGKQPWLRVFGALAFMALAYATLVGFTRATYAAFALAVACFGMFTVWSRYRSGRASRLPLGWFLAMLIVGAASAVPAFRLAGSYGLASFASLIFLAYVSVFLSLRGVAKYAPPLIAIVLTSLAINAHFSSRWAEPSVLGAVFLGLALGGTYLLASNLYKKSQRLPQFDRLLVLGGITMLPIFLAFALGGYQMDDRLSRVSGDLETRKEHWLNVIDSAKSGALKSWFGNGTGTFPGNYIAAHPDQVQAVGSFGVVSEGSRAVLRLDGGSDLTIGQRLSVEPNADYAVNVLARAQSAGHLTIALCERNLIYASEFMPHCSYAVVDVEPTDGAFKPYRAEINSGSVGERSSLQRWPTSLVLGYSGSGAVVEIDSIGLEFDGYNVLRNGFFADGLDYWFYYNDFSHLPWHVKNTFLQVWFETGWLGLVLFVVLIGMLVRANFKRHAHDSLVPVYTTGVITICLFGFFGSPLDSARVSWMFYFFLCAGLVNLRLTGKSRVAGAREGSLTTQGASRSGRAKMESVGRSVR